MKLLIKIKEWIQRLNKISEDDDGIAEDWCTQKYEGRELTEEADKNWCVFILKNLRKMHMIVSQEEKEEINKKLRAHVYCTIMKVWFFSFKQKYCEADRVMQHAFEGMNTLCQGFSGGEGCYKCEYGQIENIDVGGIDALKYIWGIFMKNEHAVGRMYSKLPANSCEKVKNDGTADVQGLPDFIRPPPPPTSRQILRIVQAQEQAQVREHRQKIADSKNEVDKIIERWGMGAPSELKEMFKKYSENLDEGDKESEWLYETFCDTVDIEYGNYGQCMDKDFCKVLIRNWNTASTRSVDTVSGKMNWREVQPDTKCAILNLWLYYYDQYVCPVVFENFYVSTVMEGMSEFMKTNADYRKCDYRSARSALGAKNKEEVKTIFKWLQKEGMDNIVEKVRNGKKCEREQGECKMEYKDGKMRVGKEEYNLEGGDKEVMKEIGESIEKVEEVKKKIQEEETQKVIVSQPQPQPPPQPGGDGCKDKNTLCDRVKCVAETWRANREINDQIFGRSWPNSFWNGDVKNRLDALSNAMKNGSNNTGDADNLCKEVNGKGKTATEKEKVACKYITKGLQHIYGIGVDKKHKKPDEAKDNRIFYQTMECAFLNAYANMLIKKTEGHACPITEQQIQDMFSKGNTKKGTWCTGEDANNNKMECVECKRDKDYGNCEIDYKGNGYQTKDKVEENVNKLLDKDSKIQESLRTISSILNSLCHRAQCVTINWFVDRKTDGGTPQNWCKFWAENDVGRVFRELSKAMTDNSKNMDNYCNNVGNSNSAEKKVCQYITRGLERIYNSQEHGDWKETEPDKQKKMKNNQHFDRVIGCIFLNAYADKLEEKAKEKSCEVKEGIKNAFDKSEDIKKNTSPCNGIYTNCVSCTRDKSYVNCTLSVDNDLWDKGADKKCVKNGNYMKKEVDGMLDPETNRDQQVQSALSALNNLCQSTAKPAAAKPAATKPATTKPVVHSSSTRTEATNGVDKAGKDATSSINTPKKVDCNSQVADANVDISVCLDDSNNLPTSSSTNLDEENEAKRGEGPKGAPGSVAGKVTIDKGTAELPGLPKNINSGTVSDPTPTAHPPAPAAPAPEGSSNAGVPGAVPGVGTPDTAPTAQGSGGAAVPGVAPGGGGGGTPSAPTKDSTINQDKTSLNTVPVSAQKPRAPAPGPSRTSLPRSATTGGAGGSGSSTKGLLPIQPVSNLINISDLTPYLPLAPVFIGMSSVTYLLWKYFFLGKKRRRYKRAHQVRGPSRLEEQLLDDVDDQADGPREYTLVKKRKQPRSAPMRRRKRERPAHRVGRRTIIDIHLEVIDECQKGDAHSMKEDFFEILVQEFMGSEFMKEENVPMDEVPSSDCGFREEDFILTEDILEEGVPKEQVPSSDSGFRV